MNIIHKARDKDSDTRTLVHDFISTTASMGKVERFTFERTTKSKVKYSQLFFELS